MENSGTTAKPFTFVEEYFRELDSPGFINGLQILEKDETACVSSRHHIYLTSHQKIEEVPICEQFFPFDEDTDNFKHTTNTEVLQIISYYLLSDAPILSFITVSFYININILNQF